MEQVQVDFPLQVDFPWRVYTSDELAIQFLKVKKRLKYVERHLQQPIAFSKIGFICTNVFFQYERMNTAGMRKPSTIDYWNKN